MTTGKKTFAAAINKEKKFGLKCSGLIFALPIKKAVKRELSSAGSEHPDFTSRESRRF
jgi:hypothetical protein